MLLQDVDHLFLNCRLEGAMAVVIPSFDLATSAFSHLKRATMPLVPFMFLVRSSGTEATAV